MKVETTVGLAETLPTTVSNVDKFNNGRIPDVLSSLYGYFGTDRVCLFGGAVRDFLNDRPIKDFDILVWPDPTQSTAALEFDRTSTQELMEDLGYEHLTTKSGWETYQGNFWPACRVDKFLTQDFEGTGPIKVDVIEIGPWVGSKSMYELIDEHTPVINSKYAYFPEPTRGFYEYPDARAAHLSMHLEVAIGPPPRNIDNYQKMFAEYVPRLLEKYPGYDVRVIYGD